MILSPGVRYMLAATFLFTTMNVLVKAVPNIPAVEIVFFRSLISLLLSYVLLKRARVRVLGKQRKWLIARGSVGAVALVLFFITLQNIPLASAVVIQFLSPIFTAIIGVFLVREPVKSWQWVFFAIAFAGILVVQGFDSRISPFYMGIGVVASFCAGLAYNIIRKLGTSEHPLVVVFYFPLVTLPLTGLYCLFVEWTMPHGIEWLTLLGIGVLTQFAQVLMTMSYQAEEVSKVASLKYIGIIYALGYGWVFFDETFDVITYAGMALVLAGVVGNVIYKHRLSNQKAKQAG
ncbi:DMT family transporter [Roseivirga sp. BDSF3-8]|uniref:DMT family transporter n=1 Tax=Roseivirga sp. BDSF3-8 TaxID=3241598 RepID=UPI003531EE95